MQIVGTFFLVLAGTRYRGFKPLAKISMLGARTDRSNAVVEMNVARSFSLSNRMLLFIIASQEIFASVGALVFEAQYCGMNT